MIYGNYWERRLSQELNKKELGHMKVQLTNGLSKYNIEFTNRKRISKNATIEAQEKIINDFLRDDITLSTICNIRNMWLEKYDFQCKADVII